MADVGASAVIWADPAEGPFELADLGRVDNWVIPKQRYLSRTMMEATWTKARKFRAVFS